MGLDNKYLTIRIVGHNTIYAYFNKNTGKNDGKKHPLFKGEGVAVWVNEKKIQPTPEPVATDFDEFI